MAHARIGDYSTFIWQVITVSINSQTPNTLVPRPTKWSGAVRFFHWISLLFLIVTWAMITLHQNSDGSFYEMLHKSFGVSFLFWMIARVISRIISQSPLPLPMPTWQKRVSELSHLILYVLLFAMPLSGILMSWYGGRTIEIFGLFELPSILARDRAQARFFNDLHTDIIWPAILVFTGIHILAALQHQFVKKDNILSRIK